VVRIQVERNPKPVRPGDKNGCSPEGVEGRHALPGRIIRRGLIVSCQASEGSALNKPEIISAMAVASEQQGAVGVRINGVRNIQTVRERVGIPIIGIEKLPTPGCSVYITPTLDSVRRVHAAGADIVALDATRRKRPGNSTLREMICYARQKLGTPVIADVATLEEALRAQRLGADFVATTLCGYTRSTRKPDGPAFRLLVQAVKVLHIPIILEGRIREPEELGRAFELGAFAVVVGTAITDLEWLVQRFTKAVPRWVSKRTPEYAEGRPELRSK
jgi:N-acylglucosamine-6-phosphate 2-epimerase